MKSLLTEKKPGQFSVRCSLRRRVPWDKMTEELWVVANERGYTREFLKLASGRIDPEKHQQGRWEVVFAACEGFETADRAEFVRHLAELHGRNPSGPRQLRLGAGLWRTPAFKPLDTTGLKVCAACGLVAEVDDRPANVLWWAEHERMCVGDELPQVGDIVTCIQIGHYGEHPARPECMLIDSAGRCASPRAVAS